MLSLRKTADLIGVDKAYVSRRVHAGKPVRDFDLADHAVYDDNGRIAGFDIREGSLELRENRPELPVNTVNVDHIEDNRRDIDVHIPMYEVTPTPSRRGETREFMPENLVNGVNVDDDIGRISFSSIDERLDAVMDDNTKLEETSPTSVKLPIPSAETSLSVISEPIEESAESGRVLPAIGLGVIAILGVDHAVNGEQSIVSRFWHWVQRVSEPKVSQAQHLPSNLSKVSQAQHLPSNLSIDLEPGQQDYVRFRSPIDPPQ